MSISFLYTCIFFSIDQITQLSRSSKVGFPYHVNYCLYDNLEYLNFFRYYDDKIISVPIDCFHVFYSKALRIRPQYILIKSGLMNEVVLIEDQISH